MNYLKLPRTLRFILISVMVSVLFFSLMRLIFYFVFKDVSGPVQDSAMLFSFYLGLKYDIRLALLLHIPILLFGWIRPLQIAPNTFGGFFWRIFLTTIGFFVFAIYFIDFGHYEYLQNRIDATILRFFYNLEDSLKMIWQTYPIIWIIAALVLIVVLYSFILKIIIKKIERKIFYLFSKKQKAIVVILFVTFYAFGIYGKISYYPLRWSDAFFSTNFFASSVSLNPVLFFYDTYKNRDSKDNYDKKAVEKAYGIIVEYLNIKKPDNDKLNYIRSYQNESDRRPNIILVFLESFAYHKTGLSGNPLNPSPNFDKLAENSILFTRYYTPHSGTARSVFTTMTGLADIELNKTSSRNPLIIKQRTIINDFKGYKKYYFLGGSASWGEIRGMLSNNIPDIQIYEEGDYESPRVDVWGISDLHLFEEANQVISKNKNQPFFAIIQTSGNHGPWTIPDDNRDFESIPIDEDKVKKYGFSSLAALNSFRFMDHSMQWFIEAAKKESYFDNTIFVFFGDHGLPGRSDHMHKSENQLLLSKFHVPLLIYAPWLIKEGQSNEKPSSAVDILPTVASIASIPYTNSTFGRNLLDNQFDDQRYAFTIYHHQNPTIGIIGPDFYFLANADHTNKRLHKIKSRNPQKNVIDQFPKISSRMENICHSIYETTRYMRLNNSTSTAEDG
jgi:phosphoglycerol transferase MdoB-like AlkP superfamily enzyme